MTSKNSNWSLSSSLVPRLCAPPSETRSGERSRISWAYYPNRVMTNEIARSVIIRSTFFTTVKLILSISIRASVPFFERVGHKMFWSLLGYIVAKVSASLRYLTWFTRPFLLVRGWGLGSRLSFSPAVWCNSILSVTITTTTKNYGSTV